MLATIPVHLIHDLLGAASTIKLARHYLPHWMFYPACAIAAFIVVCGVGAAIVKWKENRDSEQAGKIA